MEREETKTVWLPPTVPWPVQLGEWKGKRQQRFRQAQARGWVSTPLELGGHGKKRWGWRPHVLREGPYLWLRRPQVSDWETAEVLLSTSSVTCEHRSPFQTLHKKVGWSHLWISIDHSASLARKRREIEQWCEGATWRVSKRLNDRKDLGRMFNYNHFPHSKILLLCNVCYHSKTLFLERWFIHSSS